MIGKRILCSVFAVLAGVAGLGAVGIAITVLAWPKTNPQVGKLGDLPIAIPYMIAAVVMFVASGVLIWFGFRRDTSSRP